MRVLIAPTAFKGTLAAGEAARALAEGWRSVRPDDELVIVPIGDGGDGSLEMIESSLGVGRRTAPARDALGRMRSAPYLPLGDGTAFIETAAVAGLALLAPAERDVMQASTAGVGDLIRHLAGSGAQRIAIGVGGTASHDVGIGMMAALGVRFGGVEGDLLSGKDLARIRSIDLTPARDLLGDTQVIGVCDVACPLYGPGGAAERFAAQKGAAPDQIGELDRATQAFSRVARRTAGVRLDRLKYGGAGGGLAAGLRLGGGARLVRGLDWLLRICRLTEIINAVDIVVTGEGRFDDTSLQGKAAYRLAQIAGRASKQVLLAAGVLDITADHLHRLGFAATAATTDLPHSAGSAALALSEIGRRLAADLGR
jgi:glycerate kinase